MEAQFAFQDGLTEVFYDKNPELYETAFAIFEESQMNGGKTSAQDTGGSHAENGNAQRAHHAH